MTKPVAAGVAVIGALAAIIHGNTMVACPTATHVPSQSWRVNINTAGPQELDLLPGIGPIMATRIMAWRAEGNRAEDVDQLLAIHGIGPRTIEKLRPWVMP